MGKGTQVLTFLAFFLFNFFHFPTNKLTNKIRRENVLLSLIMTLGCCTSMKWLYRKWNVINDIEWTNVDSCTEIVQSSASLGMWVWNAKYEKSVAFFRESWINSLILIQTFYNNLKRLRKMLTLNNVRKHNHCCPYFWVILTFLIALPYI